MKRNSLKVNTSITQDNGHYIITTSTGKVDFVGVNYYTSILAAPATKINYEPGFQNDMEIELSVDPSWPRAKSNWLYSVPDGLRQILK